MSDAVPPTGPGDRDDDARAAPRRSARDVRWITRVKLTSGEEAQIVNISTGGILIECRAQWPPDALVDLQIVSARTVVTRGRVVRCELAGVDRNGAATYHVALEFLELFPLGAAAPPE